jgi:transposase
MPIRFKVTLTSQERAALSALVSKGKCAASKQTRARILSLCDESPEGQSFSDERIAEVLGVGVATVYRVRKAFVEEGFSAVLERKKRTVPYPRKMDGKAEAKLLALACSKPPKGHARWTLTLLANKMVELNVVDSISHEGVRQTLKK